MYVTVIIDRILRNTATKLLQNLLSRLFQVAWNENPRLAVHMTHRFPSARIYNEVRAKILKQPDKVIDEPDALHILIGASMPSDISFQLRVSED